MSAESTESLMQAMASDRRPAIWPWLVMPLITLTLFYGLNRLMDTYGQRPYGLISAPPHAASAADSTAPP